MAIPLDSGEGFFTRLGKAGGTLKSVWDHLAAGDIGTHIDELFAMYDATDADVVAGSAGLYAALEAYRASPTLPGAIQTIVQNTLVEMANDDSPLNVRTTAVAMALLLDQMRTASESLNRPTTSLGSVTAGGLNVGNGGLVASLAAADGSFQPYVFDEDVRFVCSGDVSTGSTQYAEPFAVTTPAAAQELAWNWPGGSGVSSSLSSIDPASDNAAGNLLTNSDFNTFTVANTPDSWTISVGTPGTDILAGGSGQAYAGGNCLNLVYQAAGPLTELRQTVSLRPLTAYTFSLMGKKTAGLSGAGALRLALVNAATGTVLTDPQGNACSTTFTLSGWTTGYVRKSLTTWTPRVMPTTAALQIKVTTAIADAANGIYLDWGALNAMTQLYVGGPFVSLFSGATSWQQGDTLTLPVNNAYDGLLVAMADRLFSMRQNGYVVPTSGSPTVADSLLT